MTDSILLGLLRALSRRPFDTALQGVVLDRAEEVGQPMPNLRSLFRSTGLMLFWKGYNIVGRRCKRRVLRQARVCLAYQALLDEIALTDLDDSGVPF